MAITLCNGYHKGEQKSCGYMNILRLLRGFSVV